MNKNVREDRVFKKTGANVLGPALEGFIIWLLQNALRNKKKRLYFLARDGYFMFLAAKIYVEKFALPIECRYLSCSRYSLRLPMFHLNEDEAMEYICRDSIDVNLTRIMNRAGLEEHEQIRVLDEIGEKGRENAPIPHAKLKEIKKKLKHSAAFSEAMFKHSKEMLPALEGYLQQEGLLERTRAALVDSGWVGSMQKTLNQVLAYMGRGEELEGYYWGLYELPPGVNRERYHCYYFSPEGQLREKVYFNNNLFEAIFSAPHGMTIGYAKKEGQYTPVYAPVTEERKCQMERLEGVLLGYITGAACRLYDIGSVDCVREKKTVKKRLGMFMGNPTQEEAEIYGSMYFCDDVLEYGSRSLAEEMDEKALKANHVINKILVMTGYRKGKIRESAWYEGSAVRSSERPGKHLFQYRIYKYLLYIRQMYIWRKNTYVQKKSEKQKN